MMGMVSKRQGRSRSRSRSRSMRVGVVRMLMMLMIMTLLSLWMLSTTTSMIMMNVHVHAFTTRTGRGRGMGMGVRTRTHLLRRNGNGNSNGNDKDSNAFSFASASASRIFHEFSYPSKTNMRTRMSMSNANNGSNGMDDAGTNSNEMKMEEDQHIHIDKMMTMTMTKQQQQQRRTFLHQLSMAPILLLSSSSANARGLVKFPCDSAPFLNKYHFMRAGTSLLEEEGVWSTNPLFLTNREAALSPRGMEEVEATCQLLKSEGVAPTIVRYSLAASAIDTSNIVGRELKVGRDKLVPEFNFMDPRAIGSWDMSMFDMTQDAVWAMDDLEAGVDGTGKGSRPPANEDGTPHETLADQKVRLQQLISVLETQYSGDTILLIFPDGTGPALLTCLIGGIPLNRVHEFEYASGEIRLNVNYQSASALKYQKPREAYLDKIANGMVQLKALRDDPDVMTNVKDIAYAKELKLEEEERLRKMARKEEEERERLRQEAVRKEEARKRRELQREQERLKREEERLAKQNVGGSRGNVAPVVEGMDGGVDASSSSSSSPMSDKNEITKAGSAGDNDDNGEIFDPTITTIGVATLVGSTFVSSLFVSDDENENTVAKDGRNATATSAATATANVVQNRTVSEGEKNVVSVGSSTNENADIASTTKMNGDEPNGADTTTADDAAAAAAAPTNGIPSSIMNKEMKLFDTDVTGKVILDKNATTTISDNVDDDDERSAQSQSDEAVVEGSSSTASAPSNESNNRDSSSSSSDVTLPPKPSQAWDPDEDDGGLAWLGTLSEMMAEEDTIIEDEGASFTANGEGATWE